MGWKCPECNSENSDSILRCYCGYESGQDNLIFKEIVAMDWRKKEKLKKLMIKIAPYGFVLFVIVAVFIKNRENAAFNSLTQEERDRILIERARNKSDDEKSPEEKMAEFREIERNKSVYEQNMEFARELDRMNRAAILDAQEEERREIEKYRK